MAPDLLDGTYERLSVTGPEYGGGLSNHGPMAAEALLRLGRDDAIEGWVTQYLRGLEDAVRPASPITDADWREALGDLRRVADWEAYLDRVVPAEAEQRLGRHRAVVGQPAAVLRPRDREPFVGAVEEVGRHHGHSAPHGRRPPPIDPNVDDPRPPQRGRGS
jgi:hypothetical protein